MYNNIAFGRVCNIAGWSSPVARRAHNPKVVGSNPAPATNQKALKPLIYKGFRLFAFYNIFTQMIILCALGVYLGFIVSKPHIEKAV